MKAPLKNKTARCMYKQWDYDYDSFGAVLKKARKDQKLTQRAVARHCHCARSTIWRAENGAAVNPQTMAAACDLLGVDLMQFNVEPGSEDLRTRPEL